MPNCLFYYQSFGIRTRVAPGSIFFGAGRLQKQARPETPLNNKMGSNFTKKTGKKIKKLLF